MSIKNSKKLDFTFIDLFCGAGGFSCGLERAGWNCLLGIDFDQHAMKTFAQNHPQSIAHHGNITALTEEKLRELLKLKGHAGDSVDLVVGGPPCQGFSTVGKGESKDMRNHLFTHFVKVVKWMNPKVVIFENVTGLLAKKNEPVLCSIFDEFQKLGYQMHAQVLDAHHYRVPSMRRRTFIVGSRFCNPRLIFPNSVCDGKTLPFVSFSQGLKELFRNEGLGRKILNHEKASSIPNDKITIDRLKYIPEGKGIRYQEDEEKYFPKKLHLKIDWKKLPENRLRQKKFHRIHSQFPSPTIMTSRYTYFHPTECRYLTVREAAVCQSFPGDFLFLGPISSQFRQIGNAVPPRMAEFFGTQLKLLWQSNTTKKRKTLSLSTDSAADVITQLRSQAFVFQRKKKLSDVNEAGD